MLMESWDSYLLGDPAHFFCAYLRYYRYWADPKYFTVKMMEMEVPALLLCPGKGFLLLVEARYLTSWQDGRLCIFYNGTRCHLRTKSNSLPEAPSGEKSFQIAGSECDFNPDCRNAFLQVIRRIQFGHAAGQGQSGATSFDPGLEMGRTGWSQQFGLPSPASSHGWNTVKLFVFHEFVATSLVCPVCLISNPRVNMRLRVHWRFTTDFSPQFNKGLHPLLFCP